MFPRGNTEQEARLVFVSSDRYFDSRPVVSLPALGLEVCLVGKAQSIGGSVATRDDGNDSESHIVLWNFFLFCFRSCLFVPGCPEPKKSHRNHITYNTVWPIAYTYFWLTLIS